MRTTTFFLFAISLSAAMPAQQPLRMNEIQAIGSHNSYRLPTDPKIFRLALGFRDFLPAEYDPNGWDYSHLPLRQQFEEYGIRSIELDIYHDPAGGRYSKPAGRLLTGRRMRLPDTLLRKPGMKLMHIADFDYNSQYSDLRGALIDVRDWSRSHPRHLPICIMIEPKSFGVHSIMPIWPFTELLAFDAAALECLENEIRAVFGQDLEGVIAPDDLRGGHASVRAGIQAGGWPTLEAAAGKVYFVAMFSEEEKRLYLQGHPNLEGRAMFFFGEAGAPETVFIKIDDPREAPDSIRAWVQAGYMIRTRADADTKEARTGDTLRLHTAVHTGAQLISTDYYRPDPRAGQAGWTDYKAALPQGRIAIPNQVLCPDRRDLPAE